jgi:hypothetical protein
MTRLLKLIKNIKPVTARGLELAHGGRERGLGMSNMRVRVTLQHAISYGYLIGGSRAFLKLTDAGLELLKSSSDAADAPVWLKSSRRKKA